MPPVFQNDGSVIGGIGCSGRTLARHSHDLKHTVVQVILQCLVLLLIQFLGNDLDISLGITRSLQQDHPGCTDGICGRSFVHLAVVQDEKTLYELLNRFCSRTIEVVDRIEHGQDDLKAPKPCTVCRIFDNRNQSETVRLSFRDLATLRSQDGIYPVIRENSERNVFVIVHHIVDSGNYRLGVVVPADNECVPWIQREQVKRNFSPCVLFLHHIAVTDTADHLPFDQFLIPGLFADNPHCLVQLRNGFGYIVRIIGRDVLDRFSDQESCLEGDDLIRPVLHDMCGQFITDFTGTMDTRLITLVVFPQVFDLVPVLEMGLICLFDNLDHIAIVNPLRRGKDHCATEHGSCGVYRTCHLLSLLFGVPMLQMLTVLFAHCLTSVNRKRTLTISRKSALLYLTIHGFTRIINKGKTNVNRLSL